MNLTDENILYVGESNMQEQGFKADVGKPTLSLVPKEIIYEIEKVRSFGVKKYKDPNNWKLVEVERYHEALLRHTMAIWNDVQARDKESGLLHLSHIATNVAFLLEKLNEEVKALTTDKQNLITDLTSAVERMKNIMREYHNDITEDDIDAIFKEILEHTDRT